MKTKRRHRRPLRRFWREDKGQGIVFAAISLLVLVGFVALVYNVGRLTERRAKVQVAADTAAYSGAVAEANALSTIAWCNSAMAQCYYNAVKYGVNECVAGTGALMKYKIANSDAPATPGASAAIEAAQLQTHFSTAHLQRAAALAWMRDLSRVSYSTAILSPKLAEEEMFAVARNMFPEVKDAGSTGPDAEAEGTRIAVYPSLRLVPKGDGLWRYLIKKLSEYPGWLISEIATGETIRLELINGEWYVTYTANGINKERYIFYEAPITEPDVNQQWEVRHEEPVGVPRETIVIVEHKTLGWIVAEELHNINDPNQRRRRTEIQTKAVDMDHDGHKEGTELTYKGSTYVFMLDSVGQLHIWNHGDQKYVLKVSNRQQVGQGINMTVNTVNRIDLSHGWVTISNPTVVHLGPATITLKVPPHVHCGFGRVGVSVTGFDERTMRVGAGGHLLTAQSGDGLWHKWHDPIEDYWSRHRLTPLDAARDPEAEQKWQYDYEVIGARMELERKMDERFVARHAFGDRFERADYNIPAEFAPYNWYNPYYESIGPRRQPTDVKFHTGRIDELRQAYFSRVTNADTSWYYVRTTAFPTQTYYQVDLNPCPKCEGKGGLWNGPVWEECDLCHGLSFPEKGSETRVAVSLADLMGYLAAQTGEGDAFRSFLGQGVDGGLPLGYEVGAIPKTDIYRPLVLTKEYFQYGIGVGVWRQKDKPMLFYRTRGKSLEVVGEDVQPEWGFVAVASARVAVPDDNGRVYRFESGGVSDPDARQAWLDSDYNLYAADLEPRLVGVKKQISDDAFHEDIIIAGTPLNPEMKDTSVTYLFDALLRSDRGAFGNTTWRHLRKNEEDARIGELLRNMGRSDYADSAPASGRDDAQRLRIKKRGRVDLRDPDLEDVVHH